MARSLAAVVFALGAIAMFGWIAGIPALTTMVEGAVSMKVNTAIAFLLAGGALLLTGRAERYLMIAVYLIGLVTLIEYLIGTPWSGFDEFVTADVEHPVGTPFPGRMAPNTAFAFLLVSAPAFGKHAARFAVGFGAAVTGIGWLALVGYLFGEVTFYGLPGATEMAIHTAAGFFLLGVALLIRSGVPVYWLAAAGFVLLPALAGGLLAALVSAAPTASAVVFQVATVQGLTLLFVRQWLKELLDG